MAAASQKDMNIAQQIVDVYPQHLVECKTKLNSWL